MVFWWNASPHRGHFCQFGYDFFLGAAYCLIPLLNNARFPHRPSLILLGILFTSRLRGSLFFEAWVLSCVLCGIHILFRHVTIQFLIAREPRPLFFFYLGPAGPFVNRILPKHLWRPLLNKGFLIPPPRCPCYFLVTILLLPGFGSRTACTPDSQICCFHFHFALLFLCMLFPPNRARGVPDGPFLRSIT